MRFVTHTRLPVLITTIFALLFTTVYAAPAGGDAAFMKAASEAVDKIAREDEFSGVILVARGDQVLLRKAAGFTDRERNITATPETKFPLASVTKQFTAAAIMLLVDEGKIALDDPISKHYLQSPAAWKDVRLRHLLTHSSGIEDYWIHRGGFAKTGQIFRTNNELIRLAAADPLGFEPGNGFSYSNSGYALLTAVIERVSGQSYDEFMRSRFFSPLRMRNTGYGKSSEVAVKGYTRSADGDWSAGEIIGLDTLGGFGGIYSTLDDMLIWSRAFFGGKVVSQPSMNAMFADNEYNYGFGWRFAPKYGRRLIWHTGNGSSHAAIFDRFPDDDLTVVVMTNNTSPTKSTATLLIEGKVTTFPANAARKVVEAVERLYFGRAP
jgi:CubicO group peptidase (beta-lactamase class C family)